MNGYRDFEQGHLRTSSYANGYKPGRREDYRNYPDRRKDYIDVPQLNRYNYYPPRPSQSDIVLPRGGYGITRANGIEDLDQSSFEMGVRDGNFPKFEVDHLATYTNKSGITLPKDGVIKLKQMESSTGIWTMRCLLIVERGYIVIIDKANGDELEHFPLTNLIEPTAVLKNDHRETYNNLVMFTVLDDPRQSNGPSDMHIFQSVNTPAQDIVDEILAAKGEGYGRRGHNEHIPPPPTGPAPEPFVGKFANYRATAYPRDEPIEARMQGTRLGDTRFKEVSRFHDANKKNKYSASSTLPRNGPSSSVSISWDSKHATVADNLECSQSVARTTDLAQFQDGYSKAKEYHSYNHVSGTNASMEGNHFDTWSGWNYNPKTGFDVSAKKDKKWYKFGFSKNIVQKVNSIDENKKLDHNSIISPLPTSPSVSSTHVTHRIRSDSDTKRSMEWSAAADPALGLDNVDIGRPPVGATHRVDNRASYIHKDNMDIGQNEALDRDVQLLNNCFDDIERFVSRLQHAAEAYTELERRRLSRGKKKQKSVGDGILRGRAQPPPAVDFIDIFQKFKFAINLLAKLKAHIHDPNAPELVHFLFTPLSLIYEASHDPVLGGWDLSNEAVAPLLLYDAKQLLINCLTSKELELWQKLGKSWTLLKENWNGHVPPYTPRFYNGWQPSPQLDQVSQPEYFREDSRELRTAERMQPPTFHSPEPTYRSENNTYAHNIQRPNDRPIERHTDYARREEIPVIEPQIRDDYSRVVRRDNYRPSSPPPNRPVVVAPYQENKPYVREQIPPAPKSHAEENMAFAADLKRVNAIIYEAVHERPGKNQKELTIEKGDILEVLDKSRNWWKLKNYHGETGYAPYTILKPYDYDHNAVRWPISGDYNRAPPSPPFLGSYQGDQGGEKLFRYF